MNNDLPLPMVLPVGRRGKISHHLNGELVYTTSLEITLQSSNLVARNPSPNAIAVTIAVSEICSRGTASMLHFRETDELVLVLGVQICALLR